MATENEAPKVPMMTGTEGTKDYLAFARKGGVALGVKPINVTRGDSAGQPGHVFFNLRLRSASAYGVFDDHVQTPAETDPAGSSNVVQFKPKPKSDEGGANKYGNAWPGVSWMAESTSRASTIIAILVKGSTETPELAKELLSNMKDGQVSKKVADHLVGLCKPENLVTTQEQIEAWLEKAYNSLVQALQLMIDTQEAIASEVSANAGTVMNQAEMIKKVQAKVKPKDEGTTE